MSKKQKQSINKSGKMIVSINQKYRITTREEMESYLHTKRKGASTTKNGRAYQRHVKHRKFAA